MKTTSLFVPLLTAAYVSAHGFLRAVAINGQDYTGNVPTNVQPASSDSSSIIRTVSTYFPIKGATNVGLTCGANSTAVPLVADANPGDSLAFSWKAYDLTNVCLFFYIYFSIILIYANLSGFTIQDPC